MTGFSGTVVAFKVNEFAFELKNGSSLFYYAHVLRISR